MECINIRVNNGKVDVTVDGAKLTDVHSVSVDYIKGVPLLFSCVADIGREQEERRGPRVLHNIFIFSHQCGTPYMVCKQLHITT